MFVYPSDFRNNIKMLRLALMIFLLSYQPLWAAGMWEKACDEDLAEALETNLIGLDVAYDRSDKFDNKVPKLLGIQYAPCVDELIGIDEKRNWVRKGIYRQRYIVELKWVRDLLKGDIKDVYRQAEFYRKQNGGPLEEHIALLLHQWAVEKKYLPAEFDEVQKIFSESPGQLAIGWLKLVAGRGYVPAMLDAARRFLNGDGVKKDLGGAYYWIKRAEAAHGDISGIIKEPYERLLDQMNDGEKTTLFWTSNGFGELDPGDPRVEYQRMRWRKFTKKFCQNYLAESSKRVLKEFENSFDLDGNLDVRSPRKLGAVFSLCIDQLISLAEQKKWNRKEIYLQRLTDELKWVQNLLKGDIAEVYRLAKFYQSKGGEGIDKFLDFLLHQWAAMNNHPPAQFDEIQENFSKRIALRTGGRLKRLAGQGHVPAMLDAAKRFLNGDGVKKDLGESYYWLKRAEAAHGDISSIIEKPYERLLDKMTDHEKESLARSSRFYGPLH
ncbi:MAG: hypothetical protein ACTSV1_08780 [Alphaproteobacteria bacterium]